MINALNELRLRWRDREAEYQRVLDKDAPVFASKHRIEGQVTELRRCISELLEARDSVRPLPLNEASTSKLYHWAPRMIEIFDLVAKAERGYDDWFVIEMTSLFDSDLRNDLYDLFKQLANRTAGPERLSLENQCSDCFWQQPTSATST